MPLPSLSPFSPLSMVLSDIERAIQARLYYPALLVALTVPEICMALALDKSVFVKEKHYTEFIEKYAQPRGLGCSGVDCYRLRGGVVHRANMAGHDKFTATHVIFTLPESILKLHALTIASGDKSAAMLDLLKFCGVMVEAAHAWYEDNQDNLRVKENMNNLIRYCPAGLSPFCVGQPIVASGT